MKMKLINALLPIFFILSVPASEDGGQFARGSVKYDETTLYNNNKKEFIKSKLVLTDAEPVRVASCTVTALMTGLSGLKQMSHKMSFQRIQFWN